MSRSFKKSIINRIIHMAGLRNKVGYKRYRFVISALNAFRLGHLLAGQPFSVDEDRASNTNFTLLHPAETLDFSHPELGFASDPFLRNCQEIVEGRLHRPNIFTCEISSAKFFAETGLVFDSRWRNVVETILDYQRYYTFRKTFRPRRLTRRAGVFSSVQHPWHNNSWHWIADCLPQVRSLAIHMAGRPLTLLMSSDLGQVHRDSLAAVVPDNFTVEYVNPAEWFELETFIVASHVSSRANACLPPEYYDFIRSNTFHKLDLPKPEPATGRYYISRSRAKHRRVINEEETVALLAEFGFKKILMEDYTFRQQVELFRNAEAIVSPHGAGLGGIIYGDALKVCVLYPEARPAGYFYTLARGVGHQHFCINANAQEDDDFLVDLAALRRVLRDEMNLA